MDELLFDDGVFSLDLESDSLPTFHLVAESLCETDSGLDSQSSVNVSAASFLDGTATGSTVRIPLPRKRAQRPIPDGRSTKGMLGRQTVGKPMASSALSEALASETTPCASSRRRQMKQAARTDLDTFFSTAIEAASRSFASSSTSRTASSVRSSSSSTSPSPSPCTFDETFLQFW